MPIPRLAGIKACVFDAYGTLFDVNAAAAACRAELGDKWLSLSELWRAKQLSYTWLRSMMGQYVGFWQVTQDALDYALEALRIEDAGLRRRLLDLYFELSCFPEVPDMLAALKRAGLKTAILSNGSPDMLEAAVRNAGIAGRLDAVLSVAELGIYKPDPRVYRLAVERLGVAPHEIAFQSSNGWDAHAAKLNGMRVVWVNRGGLPAERLPGPPDATIATLAELPQVLA